MTQTNLIRRTASAAARSGLLRTVRRTWAQYMLAIVRAMLGVLFVGFGALKLLRPAGDLHQFVALGFSWHPAVLVTLVGLAELAGGTALIAGLLIRDAAALLALTVGTALVATALHPSPGRGHSYPDSL